MTAEHVVLLLFAWPFLFCGIIMLMSIIFDIIKENKLNE